MGTEGGLEKSAGRVGFTLVEVLVALFVLAVGILGIASVQLNSRRNSAFTEVQSMGLAVGEQRMELLRSAPTCSPNGLATGTATDIACKSPVTYQGSGRTFTLNVTCSYGQLYMPGREWPCVTGPCNYTSFTVSIRTPISANPIVLRGGRDIDCP